MVQVITDAAVGAIIDHLKNSNLDKRHILYVMHANALEDAKAIAVQLKATFTEVENIEIHNLSPVFVTQGGPKCIAIQYIEK